jgi:hypothetical protein
VLPEAATQVFERDCLVMLGTCIAPVGAGKPNAPLVTITLDLPGGRRTVALSKGELLRLPLAAGQRARLRLEPARGV